MAETDYLAGHEDGWNEGYEAGALDKPKDLGEQLGVAPALPASGPVQLNQMISGMVLESIGGRGARLAVGPSPSGPDRGSVEITVQADGLPGLVQLLAMLGTQIASMEHTARANLARGPEKV